VIKTNTGRPPKPQFSGKSPLRGRATAERPVQSGTNSVIAKLHREINLHAVDIGALSNRRQSEMGCN
jgi:hypothetical protein